MLNEENHPDQENAAQKKQPFGAEVLSYLHDVIYILAAVIIVFLLFFRVMVVSGASMYGTLWEGDYLLLVDSHLAGAPKQGDIVVAVKSGFRGGEPIVKRVIAVEGQTVDIDFDAGIVYVDGAALEEPYVNTPTNLREGTQFPLKVEPGTVFVMGDNRNDSMDSRSTEIGLVDCREIVGKAVFLIFPGNGDENGQRQSRSFARIGAI